MKTDKPTVQIQRLCTLLGVSRQAYYQYQKRKAQERLDEALILKWVHAIRKQHRFMGGRKLFKKIQADLEMHNIKLGRDAFFDLLKNHNLLIKRRKRRVRTTNSIHNFKKWPNLIEGINLERKNQLWVSDITYLKTVRGFLYISFITDAYTHKVIGFNVSHSLKVKESIEALKMAFNSLEQETPYHLIHHSDRGFQYCSYQYVSLLRSKGIAISMTQTGDPRDNAVAERINGIIKNEYLKDLKITSLKQAKIELDKAVKLYNNQRPHYSIGLFTPNEIEANKNLKPKNLWKSAKTQNVNLF